MGLSDKIQEPLLEAVHEVEVATEEAIEFSARIIPWSTYANFASRLIADAGITLE